MVGGSICVCLPPPLFVRGNCCSTSASSQLKISCNSHSHSQSHPLTKTLSDIQKSGLIACLRAPSAELALGAARAAINGGIKVLEVVMSTPGVFEVLHELVEEYPTMSLGVGTVLKAEDAKCAIRYGAKFLMSPATIMDILTDVQDSEVLYIPGVMTPTEILSAHNAGAKIVKIYPVSSLGGVEYISALKKPFHHIPMIASQGVKIGQVGEYIARGASAVVLSDAIFEKEAVVHGEFDVICRQAQVAASIAEEAIKRLNPVKHEHL